MRVLWNFCLAVHCGLCCTLAWSSTPFQSDVGAGKDAAMSVGRDAATAYGSERAINSRVVTPMTSSTGTLITIDGQTSFSAPLQCSASEAFLSATLQPLPSGDVRIVTLAQDKDLDGTVDVSYTVPKHISGVCANGFVSCNSGTWDNCDFYLWQAAADATLSYTASPIENLGNCYCVNNSCGKGLAWSNMNEVISDVAGGIVGAITTAVPELVVTNTLVTDSEIRLFAQNSQTCELHSGQGIGLSGATSNSYVRALSGLSGSPQGLSGTASSTAESNTFLASLLSSNANTVGQMEHAQCTVARDIQLFEEIDLLDNLTLDIGIGVRRCDDCSYTVEFDLLNGTSRLVSSRNIDVNYEAISVHEPLDYEELCGANGQWLGLESQTLARPYVSTNIWQGHGFNEPAQVQLGINVCPSCINNWNAEVKTPSCENNLKLSFTFSADTHKSRLRGSFFVIGTTLDLPPIEKVRCALLPDTIADGCTALESNDQCMILGETVDSVVTVRDRQATYLSPLPSMRRIEGSRCGFDVTRDWWKKDRTYACTEDQPRDIDLSRIAYIESNSTSTEFADRRTSPEGVVSYSTGDLGISDFAPVSECQQVCKTRIPSVRDQISITGPVSEPRNLPEVYDYFYRACSAGTCPASDGEEVVTACQCMDNFAEATAIMLAMKNAGSDVICSTGFSNEPQ